MTTAATTITTTTTLPVPGRLARVQRMTGNLAAMGGVMAAVVATAYLLPPALLGW